MTLHALSSAAVLLLAILAVLTVCHAFPAGCPSCGRVDPRISERLLSRIPPVVEVTYRCDGCGRSTSRIAVTPDGA